MPMNFKSKIHSVENNCYRKIGAFHSKPTSQINENRAPFFAPLAEAKLRTNSKIPQSSAPCSTVYRHTHTVVFSIDVVPF
jgi:hypothetical protein